MGEREFTGSFPRWLQQDQAGMEPGPRVSTGGRCQALGLFSAAFSVALTVPGSGAEQPGLPLVLTRNAHVAGRGFDLLCHNAGLETAL